MGKTRKDAQQQAAGNALHNLATLASDLHVQESLHYMSKNLAVKHTKIERAVN